jgi:hypothetical protein
VWPLWGWILARLKGMTFFPIVEIMALVG